jgi:hypothetical protein
LPQTGLLKTSFFGIHCPSEIDTRNNNVKSIKQEQNKVTGIVALSLAITGILLSLIPRPFLAGFGISLLVLGGISGLRALFSGFLFYAFGESDPLKNAVLQREENPDSEIGRKKLIRRKRWNFVWAGFSFFFLAVALSLVIIASQADSPGLLGASGGASLALAVIHVQSLYFGIKTDQILSGSRK